MTTATTTTPDLTDVVALAEVIRTKRDELLSRSIRPAPRQSVWASQIPECARQGVMEFTHWDQKKLWGPETQARINTGHYVEDATLAELTTIGKEAGFKIVEQQAHLSPDMGQQYGIHGRTDAKIEWNETRKRYPVEVKKMSGYTFDKIRDGVEGLEDMRAVWWMRKYVRQLMVNLLGQNFDRGMFILINAESGAWKIIPVALDYDEAEWSLKMAKTIKSHFEAKTLPDRIDFDAEICGKCSFLAVCLPDIEKNPAVKFEDNPQLEEDIARLKEIEPEAKEHERLWKRIKEAVAGAANVAIGQWVVVNKTVMTTRYDVPDDIKKQYAKKLPTTRMAIERLGEVKESE